MKHDESTKGVFADNDPFGDMGTGINPGDVTVEGVWISHDATIILKIRDDEASFSLKGAHRDELNKLRHDKFILDDALAFEIGATIYDIYWVYYDPNKAVLTYNPDKGGKVEGVSFTRVHQ